jgi:MYXO-CTERM domain-containing protein
MARALAVPVVLFALVASPAASANPCDTGGSDTEDTGVLVDTDVEDTDAPDDTDGGDTDVGEDTDPAEDTDVEDTDGGDTDPAGDTDADDTDGGGSGGGGPECEGGACPDLPGQILGGSCRCSNASGTASVAPLLALVALVARRRR